MADAADMIDSRENCIKQALLWESEVGRTVLFVQGWTPRPPAGAKYKDYYLFAVEQVCKLNNYLIKPCSPPPILSHSRPCPMTTPYPLVRGNLFQFDIGLMICIFFE